MNKKGFIFVETIIVICVLTVGLISLYANYSKILSNVKELNTFDTTEYNYKTFFLKGQTFNSVNDNECIIWSSSFSDSRNVKICKLKNVSADGYIENPNISEILDAYIIDYLNSQDLNSANDDLFLAVYKKKDKQNPEEYLTYISSLNY